VSSSEDDVMKKSVGDDARDGGASSTEPIAPSQIRSDTPGQTDPSVADRAASTAPPMDGYRHKRPPPVPKWKQAFPSTDQVVIQIELPLYHEPHSPLDLVAIEIIIERLFEAF
jgi:hypothetical protein